MKYVINLKDSKEILLAKLRSSSSTTEAEIVDANVIDNDK